MSASIVIGSRELERLMKSLEQPGERVEQLLDAIGQQQEDSARYRITQTKRAPDGTRWAPWSRMYAKTRHAGHSLLRDEGKLVDSLTHNVLGRHAVEIGSNMHYAGYLQDGTTKPDGGVLMPARPFLSSDDGIEDPADRQEIREIVRAWFDGAVAP